MDYPEKWMVFDLSFFQLFLCFRCHWDRDKTFCQPPPKDAIHGGDPTVWYFWCANFTQVPYL